VRIGDMGAAATGADGAARAERVTDGDGRIGDL
jgi:hypothetical protein